MKKLMAGDFCLRDRIADLIEREKFGVRYNERL